MSEDDIPLAERIAELERRQARQRRVLTACVIGLLVLLASLLIPGLPDLVRVLTFSFAVLLMPLLLISFTMGLLEHVSPSGRNPPGERVGGGRVQD
jgi:uncharacterized protein involved in cysteine biosynthesis